MAQTIPGGAYQSADGSWHDANGKPISSGKVQELQKLQQEKSKALAEAEAAAARQIPGVVMSTNFAPVSPVTPAPVVPPEEEEETSTRRRSRRS